MRLRRCPPPCDRGIGLAADKDECRHGEPCFGAVVHFADKCGDLLGDEVGVPTNGSALACAAQWPMGPRRLAAETIYESVAITVDLCAGSLTA